MRRIVCLAAALVLTMTGAARTDEKTDMKALIDKAIKAAGGEEKLAKFKAETIKAKGKFYGGGGEGLAYTGEWAIQHPDKMCFKVEAGAGAMKLTYARTANGDKVWVKMNDKTHAIEKKELIDEAKEELYVGWVSATLLPLKEKSYTLAPLGEVKVDGKPAVGVRVSHKGHRDFNLFFDKDTGLLVKFESVIKDFFPMGSGNEVTQETIYSGYKEVNGVQRPMKFLVNRDGKKYVDGEITEIEVKEKVDESEFGKP